MDALGSRPSSATLRVLLEGAVNTGTPRAGCGEIYLVGADGKAADRQQAAAGGIERCCVQPGARADTKQVDTVAQRAGERVLSDFAPV